MKKSPQRIGVAIIGAGRVGLFRGEVAARHPQVDFIGLAELKPDRAKFVAEKIGEARLQIDRDFPTQLRRVRDLHRHEAVLDRVAAEDVGDRRADHGEVEAVSCWWGRQFCLQPAFSRPVSTEVDTARVGACATCSARN